VEAIREPRTYILWAGREVVIVCNKRVRCLDQVSCQSSIVKSNLSLLPPLLLLLWIESEREEEEEDAADEWLLLSIEEDDE